MLFCYSCQLQGDSVVHVLLSVSETKVHVFLKNAKQRTASESSLELKAHLHILYIKQKIKIHLILKNLELIHIQMHTLLTNMIIFC